MSEACENISAHQCERDPIPSGGEEAIPVENRQQAEEEAIYNRFPRHRKYTIVAIVSFYGFLSPLSSISILSATPEVASYYGTSGTVVNISNELYMLFMGLSAPFWAPLSQVYGRRIVSLFSGAFFFSFSLGNVFATNLAAYFILRILVAFQGTSFLVIGSAVIEDIYAPKTRGTAHSWFLLGSLLGPIFGPLISGIVITYQPWQVIFGLQAGLAGLALVLAALFLPETLHYRQDEELAHVSFTEGLAKLWAWTNPFRVADLLRQPGIVMVALASSSLIWNMYTLLCPIRYVLNPQFNLTSPMQSALFYLAPGMGYLVGAIFGGRWSDNRLKKMIKKRGGKFIPEDRLCSAFLPLGIVIPASILLYGWTVDAEAGGIPVPVVAMFFQGVGQLFALPSLNTYCLDVMPGRTAEVIALNYMLRYFFAAGGTAAALPAINYVGVGWFSTISSLFLITTACLVAVTYKYNPAWREKSINGRMELFAESCNKVPLSDKDNA